VLPIVLPAKPLTINDVTDVSGFPPTYQSGVSWAFNPNPSKKHILQAVDYTHVIKIRKITKKHVKKQVFLQS
jgi:hypothetical protein